MGGPIFQKTISSAMTTSRGFRMGYGMSKLGRFGIVNTGVKNQIIAGNMVQQRSMADSVLSQLGANKQEYNRTFLTKKILEEQVSLISDDNISPQLKNSDGYVYRHIGNSETATKRALDFLGVSSMNELVEQVVPPSIRLTKE